jgi:hypothetical protein
MGALCGAGSPLSGSKGVPGGFLSVSAMLRFAFAVKPSRQR